jgi:hypothetical protein
VGQRSTYKKKLIAAAILSTSAGCFCALSRCTVVLQRFASCHCGCCCVFYRRTTPAALT